MMTVSIEDKQLISRAEDLLDMAQRQYTCKHSGFLSPHERIVLQRNLKAPRDIKTDYFGGYDEAERSVLLCYPDDFELSDFGIPPITSLLIEGKDLERLNHRDYLGSLLGLGLKREKIGDILSDGKRCYIFVLEEIAPYILLNLSKIGSAGIQLKQISLDEVKVPEKKTQAIEGTVSSLRLDNVLSLALNTSRSKAVEYLRSGRVMLNWEPEENVSKTLKEGDMLSIRGFGRVKLTAVGGKTRKDRTHISLAKYV